MRLLENENFDASIELYKVSEVLGSKDVNSYVAGQEYLTIP